MNRQFYACLSPKGSLMLSLLLLITCPAMSADEGAMIEANDDGDALDSEVPMSWLTFPTCNFSKSTDYVNKADGCKVDADGAFISWQFYSTLEGVASSQLPILLKRPVSQLTAIKYQCAGNICQSCVLYVWNVQINGNQSVQQITANKTTISLQKPYPLPVDNVTLQLDMKKTNMSICGDGTMNINEISLSYLANGVSATARSVTDEALSTLTSSLSSELSTVAMSSSYQNSTTSSSGFGVTSKFLTSTSSVVTPADVTSTKLQQTRLKTTTNSSLSATLSLLATDQFASESTVTAATQDGDDARLPSKNISTMATSPAATRSAGAKIYKTSFRILSMTYEQEMAAVGSNKYTTLYDTVMPKELGNNVLLFKLPGAGGLRPSGVRTLYRLNAFSLFWLWFRVNGCHYLLRKPLHNSMLVIPAPMLNKSYSWSIGAIYIGIIDMSFMSGSVLVNNWLVLTQDITLEQINQTVTQAKDLFDQAGITTDNFDMEPDPNYRGFATSQQANINALMISVVSGVLALVIVILAALTSLVCRRYILNAGALQEPALGSSRFTNHVRIDGMSRDESRPSVSSSSEGTDTSTASTSSENVWPYVSFNDGFRLPRLQLMNAIWQAIPSMNAFNRAVSDARSQDGGVDNHPYFYQNQSQNHEPVTAAKTPYVGNHVRSDGDFAACSDGRVLSRPQRARDQPEFQRDDVSNYDYFGISTTVEPYRQLYEDSSSDVDRCVTTKNCFRPSVADCLTSKRRTTVPNETETSSVDFGGLFIPSTYDVQSQQQRFVLPTNSFSTQLPPRSTNYQQTTQPESDSEGGATVNRYRKQAMELSSARVQYGKTGRHVAAKLSTSPFDASAASADEREDPISPGHRLSEVTSADVSKVRTSSLQKPVLKTNSKRRNNKDDILHRGLPPI